MFYLFLIFCILFTRNVNSWEGYHTLFDDELPSISWKECGISVRDCDLNSTFKDPFVSSRIMGGEYANTGDYPWFTLLVIYHTKYENGQVVPSEGICGGAIINEWWILTAAHCVQSLEIRNNQSFVVLMGAINMYGGAIIDVERVVIHSNYLHILQIDRRLKDRINGLRQLIYRNSISDENQTFITQLAEEYEVVREKYMISTFPENWDICLLKVKNRIVPVFNKTHYKVNSICLPKNGITNTKNETAVFMGMGITERFGKSLSNLKKGMTIIMDTNFCDKGSFVRYNHSNIRDTICFTSLITEIRPLFNSSDSTGDSGSPLIQYISCRGVQIGIISHEDSTKCDPKCYSWLTRVSSFMPWIRSVILQNNVIIISETNISLIVSVITITIIAVILCFLLILIILLVLNIRPQQS